MKDTLLCHHSAINDDKPQAQRIVQAHLRNPKIKQAGASPILRMHSSMFFVRHCFQVLWMIVRFTFVFVMNNLSRLQRAMIFFKDDIGHLGIALLVRSVILRHEQKPITLRAQTGYARCHRRRDSGAFPFIAALPGAKFRRFLAIAMNSEFSATNRTCHDDHRGLTSFRPPQTFANSSSMFFRRLKPFLEPAEYVSYFTHLFNNMVIDLPRPA